jgi:hypothetical protein
VKTRQKDPVCNMNIDENTAAASSMHKGKTSMSIPYKKRLHVYKNA